MFSSFCSQIISMAVEVVVFLTNQRGDVVLTTLSVLNTCDGNTILNICRSEIQEMISKADIYKRRDMFVGIFNKIKNEITLY